MSRMSAKRLGQLKVNCADLPLRIGWWKRQGQHEKAAAAQRILDESIAEIARRAAKVQA